MAAAERRDTRVFPSVPAAAVSLRRIAWVVSSSPGLQLPRLSGAYALDVPDILLKQRRALARHGIPVCFAYRNSAKRGHPVYLHGQDAIPTERFDTRGQ